MPLPPKVLGDASKGLVKGGRMAILGVQPFHGLFKIFNPILVSRVKPYAPDLAKYGFPDANKCIETIENLLRNAELEEYYLGMICIA